MGGYVFYTLQEVASMFRVSDDTLRRLIESDKLAANRVGGQWRISDTALDRYLANQLSECHAIMREKRDKAVDKAWA